QVPTQTAAPEVPQAEQTPAEQASAGTTPEASATDQPQAPEASPAKAKRARKASKPQDDGKATKLSALDAAAKVLGETGQAMTCKELIAAMAAKGYWTSPGG